MARYILCWDHPWARGRGYFDIETPNLDSQTRSHYIILSSIGPFQNVFHLCGAPRQGQHHFQSCDRHRSHRLLGREGQSTLAKAGSFKAGQGKNKLQIDLGLK